MRLKRLILLSLGVAATIFTFTAFLTHYAASSSRPLATIAAGKEHFTMVVLILTAVSNVEQRDMIRSTWTNLIGQQRSKVTYRFLIGQVGLDDAAVVKLTSEGPDILLLNVEDHYEKLTPKVLAGLRQISTRFSFDFVIKVDDDSFVNVVELMQRLLGLKIEERWKRLYWGYFTGSARVKKAGPWAEPDWVLSDRYLPYARGGGYVLGAGLVQYLATNAEYLKLYKNEDVAVGAWLAGIDVWYKHDRRFDTEYRSRGCSNGYVVTHKQSPRSMQKMYGILKSTGKLCIEEVTVRRSYEYDWSVPPSQCCSPDLMDTDL